MTLGADLTPKSHRHQAKRKRDEQDHLRKDQFEGKSPESCRRTERSHQQIGDEAFAVFEDGDVYTMYFLPKLWVILSAEGAR